jgi:hypothetical protein
MSPFAPQGGRGQGMKKYEMIREIFNSCSGNQMRDVHISVVETDDVEDYVRVFLDDPRASVERSVDPGGAVIFDIEVSGLRQRIGFSEI